MRNITNSLLFAGAIILSVAFVGAIEGSAPTLAIIGIAGMAYTCYRELYNRAKQQHGFSR